MYINLSGFKTSDGCTSKKKSWAVRHMKCPQPMKLFLKSASALFETSQMNYVVLSSPALQTVGQNITWSDIIKDFNYGGIFNAFSMTCAPQVLLFVIWLFSMKAPPTIHFAEEIITGFQATKNAECALLFAENADL